MLRPYPCGVLVKKAPEEPLRELVLAIGREAQAQGLSEEDVEKDIDRWRWQQLRHERSIS